MTTSQLKQRGKGETQCARASGCVVSPSTSEWFRSGYLPIPLYLHIRISRFPLCSIIRRGNLFAGSGAVGIWNEKAFVSVQLTACTFVALASDRHSLSVAASTRQKEPARRVCSSSERCRRRSPPLSIATTRGTPSSSAMADSKCPGGDGVSGPHARTFGENRCRRVRVFRVQGFHPSLVLPRRAGRGRSSGKDSRGWRRRRVARWTSHRDRHDGCRPCGSVLRTRLRVRVSRVPRSRSLCAFFLRVMPHPRINYTAKAYNGLSSRAHRLCARASSVDRV